MKKVLIYAATSNNCFDYILSQAAINNADRNELSEAVENALTPKAHSRVMVIPAGGNYLWIKGGDNNKISRITLRDRSLWLNGPSTIEAAKICGSDNLALDLEGFEQINAVLALSDREVPSTRLPVFDSARHDLLAFAPAALFAIVVAWGYILRRRQKH